MNYSMDLGLLTREKIWEQIGRFPKRNVSEKQLAKDLEELENAG